MSDITFEVIREHNLEYELGHSKSTRWPSAASSYPSATFFLFVTSPWEIKGNYSKRSQTVLDQLSGKIASRKNLSGGKEKQEGKYVLSFHLVINKLCI